MNIFFQKRKKSFEYAFSGIGYVLRTQKNSWIHLLFTILVIAIAFLLKLSILDWAILIICFGMVWVAEFFNTAIETAVNLASPEYHPSAKICKDVAAGAVLIAVICSIIIGALILGPPLYRYLFM